MDDYLNYLIEICNLNKYKKKYYNLFKLLHDISFQTLIERDKNRIMDAIYHREFFVGVLDVVEPCSVMEIFVGLAIRIDNEFIGDPKDPHPDIIFMEMIRNMGLHLNLYNPKYSKRIIENWMFRRFYSDGLGSPFPVKKDPRDQRELEIWDQMISYLNENY